MAKSAVNLEILEAMVEAGATATAIVSKVREMLEARRVNDRARQQRSRASKQVGECLVSESNVTPGHAVSRHVTRTADSSSFLEEVSKKDTTTAASRAREVALEIAKRVAATCGYPELPEDADHVAAWLADGFTEQFVLAVVRQVMARRRPPRVVKISYFDGPLVDERQRQSQRPLPLVGVISENKDVRRTPPTGWQARRDEWYAALDELGERVQSFKSGSEGD